MVVEKLEKALAKRSKMIADLQSEGTNCYRFLSAMNDKVPGLVIEVFGSVGIAQFHTGKCELSIADLKIACRWCMDQLGLKQVYLKKFVSDRSKGELPEELLSPQPFVGAASEPALVAEESGLKFLIKPYVGFSVGLFLDQRENRKTVTRKCKGKPVLNLFSYTCAFSVYAAKAGATVTSVDISSKYLDWGKENFAANGIKTEDHRFFSADVRYFLRAAIKRQEKYDRIIVDPPSFSHGKKEAFSVKRNLKEVLEQCRQVLSPDGTIFVSTNFAQWAEKDLEDTIYGALGSCEYLELPSLPDEFEVGSMICRWVRPKGV